MTLYPNSIDTSTSLPPATGNPVTDANSTNAVIGAVIAIETELGILPAGAYASVRTRLDILETRSGGGGGGFSAGGDLSGSSTDQVVIGIRGVPISAASPTTGQILEFNGSQWLPVTPGSGFTAGGDLSGSSTDQVVIGIQGNAISNATPTNGQVLTWSSSGSHWAPASTASPVTWASDLVGSTNTNQFIAAISGNAGAGGTVLLNITGLQFTVAQTSPTINQVSTSSSSATDLTIQAQGATGAGHNGGNLVLAAGTSGSATAGVVNIQAAGSTIVEIDGNKLWSQKGWRQNVTAVSASSYNTLATDNIVATDSTANVIAINLPASPNTGDTYQIKDSTGQAAANNVTISGNGKNIDGIATFAINVAYGCITVVYVGSAGWNII